MEKLTWLASERRLCGEGDSEEDNSPNSPTSPTSPISQNSQEDNSEDEEDGGLKGEELEPTEGEGGKLPEEDAPQEDDPPQNSGKGAGRGRGLFSRLELVFLLYLCGSPACGAVYSDYYNKCINLFTFGRSWSPPTPQS